MLNESERQELLEVAHASITQGIEQGRPLRVEPEAFSEPLRALGATFVTLELDGALRGCIGTLEPHRPLVEDVAANAYASAFSDPRFPPLAAFELPRLTIKISLLTPAEPVRFDSEEGLVASLRPGVDGLVLSYHHHRGTFLPSVWESLPDPHEFLRHLKLKAGLAADWWSNDAQVERYGTESFGNSA